MEGEENDDGVERRLSKLEERSGTFATREDLQRFRISILVTIILAFLVVAGVVLRTFDAVLRFVTTLLTQANAG